MTLEPTPEAELRDRLRAFAAAEHVLIALDFDGVLAPLIPDPTQSRPVPEASRALERLAAAPRVDLAVVSGRPAEDLNHLASPPPGTWLVGSHGAQMGRVDSGGQVVITPLELSADQRTLLERVESALEAIAEQFEGAWVERKPAAAALHTRPIEDPQTSERALALAMAGPGSWPGTYAQPGKQVLEIPVVRTTKGQALADLRHRLRTEYDRPDLPVLFAGDDVTDETALATLSGPDLGVKVGTAESVASVRVADEEAVAALLHELADLRAAERA